MCSFHHTTFYSFLLYCIFYTWLYKGKYKINRHQTFLQISLIQLGVCPANPTNIHFEALQKIIVLYLYIISHIMSFFWFEILSSFYHKNINYLNANGNNCIIKPFIRRSSPVPTYTLLLLSE